MSNVFLIFSSDFWTGQAQAPYALLIPALLIALCLNIYAFYMSYIGAHGWKRPTRNIEARTRRRFFAVVAAHDEEAVIEDLLRSLQAQEYPREAFDVFVVADNCSDRTAELVRQYGFSAFERFNPKQRGKTWAIKDLLGHIEHSLGVRWWEDYAGMAMFDADNVVHPRFFAEMNNHFEMHPDVKAVQGYADTKNPEDNALTRIYAIAYWSASRFWQLPRFRKGLSAGLAGTGFVIESRTLREIGWNPQSMVEDLELTTQLVLRGERVHWNEWAVIYDEKPLSVKVSYRQRERWMRGHWWCFMHYGRQMLRALMHKRQLRYLDMLLYLASPAQMVGNFTFALLGYLWGVASALYYFGAHGAFYPWHALLLLWPALTVIQTIVLLVVAPTVYNMTHRGQTLRQGLTFRYVSIILTAWLYFLMWLPIIVQSLLRFRDQGNWVRTPHTRQVTAQVPGPQVGVSEG
ncbi:glycosyltransferase family 2 protein [Deinococcus koreensis]|uniref:Glycosyl transferase family 2 n=1 Tax=Deinococcus koreensis TaxID=2054903 RepID=A0A2K3UYF6_9DEIO|nr:glycosyltransferase family 2 protein [Deinococcus koreensis]PNY81569.1 glycosyl transferase family 2 [Deinococcus koreensis]